MAYENLQITALNDPVSDLETNPDLGPETLKAWFDKNSIQIMMAFNAALVVLGQDKDLFDAWKAQLEALNLDAGAAAALAAAVVDLQDAQAATEADVADRELKTLPFTDQAVSTSDWATYTASGTEETALYADGYTYRKSLALEGVLATMRILECAMSHSTSKCGTSIAGNALPYDGGIKLYAKGVPTSAFSILSISFGRA
jgi:hypothetical protein